MKETKTIKVPYFYACCPNCKAVLIQAQNGLEGYIKCPKCEKYIHVTINNGIISTNIKNA